MCSLTKMGEYDLRYFSTLLALSAAISCDGEALAQSGKPTVAVVKIDDLAGTQQADQFTAMIESAIAGSGKFRLMERERMGKLVGEQTRARGGMVTTNTPGKVGGFEGVDYLIYGSITSISAKAKADVGATLLTGLLSGRNGGSQTCSNTLATLGVDIKITDADSGEIKYSTHIDEQQKSASSCGGNGEIDASALLRAAADRVAGGLVTAIYPIQIASVQADGTVVLNYGEGALDVGSILAVYSRGEAIRDPASGEIIGNDETKLGLVRVTEVTPRMSKATAITGFVTAPQIGAIARAASAADVNAVAKPKKKR